MTVSFELKQILKKALIPRSVIIANFEWVAQLNFRISQEKFWVVVRHLIEEIIYIFSRKLYTQKSKQKEIGQKKISQTE